MSGPVDLDSIDRQVVIVELSEMLDFVADFLAHAEGPLLRADFARFTSGAYSLDEMGQDLRRLAGWLIDQESP